MGMYLIGIYLGVSTCGLISMISGTVFLSHISGTPSVIVTWS